MAIDFDRFTTIIFIDSNIALECLALEQLPWKEIDATGSILLLVTPTVVQEVDSKKNHARLGDHARRFNKTLRPLLTTGNDTAEIRKAPKPLVEIALADCPRIDWSGFPDLDSEEADARVAVQAQYSRGPNVAKRVLVSHDIRPLFIARSLGLKVHQIGDNWLRPKEISEAEKKAANLQKEISLLKSREPKLEIQFDDYPSQIDTVQINDLSDDERDEIKQKIFSLNPMPRQDRSNILILSNYDHTLDERYTKWMNEVIPNFMAVYERKMELNYGQIKINFKIVNDGQVPAEGLLIRVSAQGGWLNERYTLASPGGPNPPSARGFDYLNRHLYNSMTRPQYQPGKHEFVVIQSPVRGLQAQISCQDFRHGYDHEYSVIAWVDPHADGLTIDVTVTASNLHGEVNKQIRILPKLREVKVSEIIDLDILRFREQMLIDDLLNKAIEKGDFSMFEFDGSNSDE